MLQPAGMQGQMIFWEGWFLSQYDADFCDCLRIMFWHGELRCGQRGRRGWAVPRRWTSFTMSWSREQLV